MSVEHASLSYAALRDDGKSHGSRAVDAAERASRVPSASKPVFVNRAPGNRDVEHSDSGPTLCPMDTRLGGLLSGMNCYPSVRKGICDPQQRCGLRLKNLNRPAK